MTVTPNSDTAPWDAPPPPLEPVRRQRGRNLRWLAAGTATVLVFVALAVVYVLANPPAAPGGVSPLARYAPAESAAYVEARLDLPGGQRDRLIAFMSHFPGFADPQSFDQKISETIDELLRSESSDFRWSEDIEPWFGGQVVVFAVDVTESAGRPQSGTVVLSVKDRAALDVFLDKERARRAYESSEYLGVTIWTGRPMDAPTSMAATNDVLLLSRRIEDLHAALDVDAGARAALVDEERFVQAMGKLSGDRLAALYMDGEQMVDAWLSMGARSMIAADLEQQLEQFPGGAVVGQLRVESDHMLLETRLLPREGQSLPALPQNRSTNLAAQFPADVVGYAEIRDVGQGIKQVLAQLMDESDAPAAEILPPEIEQFLGTSPEDFFDFVGDTAIAVEARDSTYGVGLIAVLTDEDVAGQRLERLITSLRMAIVFGGDVPLTIEEGVHAGVPLTIIRLRDESQLGTPVSLSFAVTSGRLLLGLDDFVTAAIDRGAEGGLAGSSGYRAALTAAGESNGGLFYLDLAQLRAIAEAEMSQHDRGEMDELWPYVEHFAHVIGTLSADGDELVTRLLLFVE